MAGPSIRLLALLAIVGALVAGCENAANPFAKNENSADGPVATQAARSVRLVDRDIEAPEVFQTTDSALWDGRPSLGGVWVASPDAVNPERVILRNEANGKFVIGALFRRERDNPGPKLQVSSEAADALGMLAGQPGQINVTALRRDENKSGADGAADPEEVAVAGVAVAGVAAAETADPIAAASAAIDRANGANGPDAPEGAPAADGEGTVAAAPPDDLDPTPRPGETKRAARKRVRIATRAAAAQTPVAVPDAGQSLDAPLAAAAPIAAAPIAVAPIADAAPDAAPKGGSSRVQIGIFSVEKNAQRAVDMLKAGGIDADLKREDISGKGVFSVIATGAGPAKAFLAKVKALGFDDAYVVSG